MDKRTILAVVLVVIVITASMFIQATLFSGNDTSQTTAAASTAETTQASTNSTELTEEKVSAIVSKSSGNSTEKFTFETDLYEITFDPVGASISSLMMKEHADAYGNHVDIIFNGGDGKNAFLMYWGDDLSNPILDTFSYVVEDNKVIFTNSYKTTSGQSFTMVKTYEFKDNEYLFAVNVDIVGGEGFSGLNTDGYA